MGVMLLFCCFVLFCFWLEPVHNDITQFKKTNSNKFGESNNIKPILPSLGVHPGEMKPLK